MEINEELKKEMSEIDLMELMGVSDTIVSYMEHDAPMFTNVNTGTNYDKFDKCIRDGVKHIYIDIDCEYPRRTADEGYLAKYFPEKDILLAVIYELKRNCKNGISTFSWEEKFRLIISRDNYYCFSTKENKCKKYVRVHLHACDLCGQLLDFKGNILSMPIINMPCQSGEAIKEFCKGILWIDDSEFYPFTWDRCNLNNIISEINNNSFEKHCGLKEIDMDGIQVSDMDIPKKVTEKLLKLCVDIFNYWVEDEDMEEAIRIYEGTTIGMLQNCGGEYVLRKFFAYPYGMINDYADEIQIKYIEFCRIHITERFITEEKDLEDIYVPLVYFDRKGIKNGPFKYAGKYLKEAVQETIQAISEEDYSLELDCPGTIGFSYLMAFYPPFERLYNMLLSSMKLKDVKVKKEEIEEMLGKLRFYANTCSGITAKDCIEYFMGPINDRQKELYKILGISKSVLRMLATGRCKFYHIEMMKDIFHTNKIYGFIENMDEKNSSTIVSFINKGIKVTGDGYIYQECLKSLIGLFGSHNVLGYIRFLSAEYMSEKKIEKYYDYIKKLVFINQEVGGIKDSFQWKVKYQNFEKIYETVIEPYSVLNDKKNFADELEKFKLLSKDWEKYEYSDDKFSVICPKGPTDLLIEGFRLNHCAKTFIGSVSSGFTIIMFIRETKNLNKPFFTLEIRSGQVRQCHGYNNCNVTNNDGLLDFISKYCKIKNLEIVNLNMQFGPYYV